MRSKGHRRHGGSWVPRQGRPSQAIIEGNRKTELCRNWESKGVCSFGARCAFAHGDEELRYRTLREMENAGRIPDASKYRCYPCMTWVATGSCPYSSRCVFIHDPRIKGPREAWLYAGSQGKGQSAYPSSDNCFFFPDMVRDPDTLELPTHPARYDLEPFMARAQDVGTSRAVYSLWYSFLSTLLEAATKNNTALTTLWSSSSSSGGGGGGGGRKTSGGRSSSSNSSISRAPSNHTYKEAVVAPTSDSSRASADRALLPRPQLPRRAASVTTIPAAAAAAAAATRGGGTVESSVAAPPLALKRCASLPPTLAREMVPIPCEEVQHLPVFSCLSRGVPARAVTTPFSGRTSAEALQLDGAPGRFDPSKRASSSTWNGVPPEFLLDALAPPASSCPKTKHVISDGAPRCRAFIDVTDVPDGTTAVSPGSNSGSNTNSTATFSPPSTLSPSSSDCGQFSRRNISFPPSRGKTALGNGIVIGDEPHCWSLYGGEGLAIGETVPPEPRGSLKAAAPAASSDRVSFSRVRNGYAVVHHRKQQLQEQQQQRQLQQHNRVGVDAAMQTSVSSLFALPSF